MLVTLLGMVIDVRLRRLEKAEAPIAITSYSTLSYLKDDGITTSPE